MLGLVVDVLFRSRWGYSRLDYVTTLMIMLVLFSSFRMGYGTFDYANGIYPASYSSHVSSLHRTACRASTLLLVDLINFIHQLTVCHPAHCECRHMKNIPPVGFLAHVWYDHALDHYYCYYVTNLSLCPVGCDVITYSLPAHARCTIQP